MKRWGRFSLFGVVLLIVLWTAAFYRGSHSEGFHFLEQRIRASQQMQGLVGRVQRVSLPALGRYREKFVGSDRWVSLIVEVQGDKGSVRVDAQLQRHNGVWVVTGSSVGTQSIDLGATS